MKPLFLALCLAAMPALCHAAENETPFIRVSGTATVKVPTDRLVWTVEIKSVARELSDAGKTTDSLVATTTEKLKSALGDAVKVTTSALQSGREYEMINGTQSFSGFSSSRTLRVTLTNLEKAPEVDAILLGDSKIAIHGIQRESSKMEETKARALDEAAKAAQAKAAQLASQFGKKAGAVLEVTESTDIPMPIANRAMAFSASGGMPDFDDVSVTQTVTARFALE